MSTPAETIQAILQSKLEVLKQIEASARQTIAPFLEQIRQMKEKSVTLQQDINQLRKNFSLLNEDLQSLQKGFSNLGNTARLPSTSPSINSSQKT